MGRELHMVYGRPVKYIAMLQLYGGPGINDISGRSVVEFRLVVIQRDSITRFARSRI